MPQQIRMPNGEILQFPDGMNDDAIRAAILKAYPADAGTAPGQTSTALAQASQQPSSPKPIGETAMAADAPWYHKLAGAADDIARIGADALTFGGADHIAGYLGGDGVNAERAKTEAAKERSGVPGVLASLLGGAATGSGLNSAGITATRFIPEAASGRLATMGRMGASIVDGSILGTIDSKLHGNDPAQGAAYGAIAGAGGHVLGSALAGMGEKVGAAFNRPGPVPDRETIKSASQAAYNKADEAGVVLGAGAMQRVANDVKTSLADFGYHPQLQPRIATALSELDRVSQGPITAKGVDVTRRIAQSAAQSQDPSERALGGMIIGKLDDALANVRPSDVISGDPTAAAAAYKEGRDLWRRQSKMQEVADAMVRAERNAASSGSGGNIDNATRQAFKGILNSAEKSRGYTADELSAMEDIVRGTPSQNAMRLVGKLSPSGNGLMAALGIGATAANPIMAVPAITGILAKSASDKTTSSGVEMLARIIASGGTRADALPPPNALQRLSKSERDALIKGLIGAGVATTSP